MDCKVTESEEFKKVRGDDIMKIKYFINLNEKKYVALMWDTIEDPIVYDKCFENELGTDNWYVMNVGYANNHTDCMHSSVAKLCGINTGEGKNMSIDHINECKLDNRKDNLRYVSQSEQNSNRKSRSDKVKPCQELIDIGVEELPRHVRWDKTEQKFILEKHPYLIQEVALGIRKKPAISGSKSTKLSVVEKFSDIMARLEELEDKYDGDESSLEVLEFQLKKDNLRDEYEIIKKTIYSYENRVYTPPKAEKAQVSDKVSFTRNTIAGRKSESKLPTGCGVSFEQLPKYCYYVEAKNGRGDYFELSKNPKVPAWRTSSSKSISTLDKFKSFMEKYNECEF